MNENGGISGFYCKYIDKSEEIGVLHHTLLYPVEKSLGKRIESFFNTKIVKFIFLITQYSSGKMTANERHVANSITIPPEDVTDYYKFFGIEEHKKYIDETLENYNKFSAPKRDSKTRKANNTAYKTADIATTRKTKPCPPCPEGKVCNPKTGRCVKVKQTKKAKKGGSKRHTRKIRRN